MGTFCSNRCSNCVLMKNHRVIITIEVTAAVACSVDSSLASVSGPQQLHFASINLYTMQCENMESYDNVQE